MVSFLFNTFSAFLLLFSPIVSNGENWKSKKEVVVFGILLKTKKISDVNDEKIKQLLDQYHLKKKSYFKSIEAFHFVFKDKSKKSNDTQLNNLCIDLLKNPKVVHCELDYKFSLNEVECEVCVGVTCSQEELQSVVSSGNEIHSSVNCRFFKDDNPKHKVNGLTKFWAQEYTGADLVREDLKQINLSQLQNLVGVLDSSGDKHGEYVSELIASSRASGLIPLSNNKTLSYESLEGVGVYIARYERELKKCQRNTDCPHYVNNSMGWGKSEFITKTIRDFVGGGGGRVFITAAGNESTSLRREEPHKQVLGEEGKLIVVASHGYDGYHSRYSNFSDQIVISAPSGNQVTSYDYLGNEESFGGTSGATPQVTASLAAFSLVTGVKLNTIDSKLLLKNTATLFYPEGNLAMGAGHLNSYKIYAVAKR